MATGPDQGRVVEPGKQVGKSDDAGQHRHHPRVPKRQSGSVLTVDLRWSGHLREGGHIRSGPGIGGLCVTQTLVGFSPTARRAFHCSAVTRQPMPRSRVSQMTVSVRNIRCSAE
ncbi:MAG TPA: hypothetical protein VE197_00005 [Mycobacterium sp.]|nr:hypothetical protein [Mycobacterium sp.]